MDQLASGIAAHWMYKESQSGNNIRMNSYIQWLRDLVDIIQSEDKSNELLELERLFQMILYLHQTVMCMN